MSCGATHSLGDNELAAVESGHQRAGDAEAQERLDTLLDQLARQRGGAHTAGAGADDTHGQRILADQGARDDDLRGEPGDDTGPGADPANVCTDRKSTRYEPQSITRISYAVYCLKKTTNNTR